MFAELYSDINPLKSGLLHLTGQPYFKKGRSAKVKDGIGKTKALGTILLIYTPVNNGRKLLIMIATWQIHYFCLSLWANKTFILRY